MLTVTVFPNIKIHYAFGQHICFVMPVLEYNPVLTISTVAPQYIPGLWDIEVGHGQGHVVIHRPARALLAQVEEAA